MPERLTILVFAKRTLPGAVKTRLLTTLSAQDAACVHAAMLDCVLARVSVHLPDARHILALTGRGDVPALPEGWETLEQAPGDLGARLHQAWLNVGGGPAMFLGVDSPDVPAAVLQGAASALEASDVACGRTEDGGYWTLAARCVSPALFAGIDWGTQTVYDQTRSAAAGAGLSFHPLPAWHDVDTPDDLAALLRRLRHADEPALQALRARLQPIAEVQHHG